MDIEIKVLFETMYNKYRRMLISKKECAGELGLSCSTLDRQRREGMGVQYIKEKNGNVMYPLIEVAKYIIAQQIRTV